MEGRRPRPRRLYALVLPRFRSRPPVSSCESGIWSGAAIASFPCAATLCMSVSHMTSLIPLARASCAFNLATSSSSSDDDRPSGRAAGSAPSFSAGGLGCTKCSQSRRSSSRGYAVTDSCVAPCRKTTALERPEKKKFLGRYNTPFVRGVASSSPHALHVGVPRACAGRALWDAPESRSPYPRRGARGRRGLAALVVSSGK